MAIFMSRIKNDKAPVINEDGGQTRDFVHIKDVTAANIAALESDHANYQIFNVGTGRPVTIKEVAEILILLYRSRVTPEISRKVRKLDVRHCFADTTKLKTLLGWEPAVSFEDGLSEIIEWSRGERAHDRVDLAMAELEKRGLR